MVLEIIRYSSEHNQLEVLDQLRLPYTVHFDRITSCEEGWACIKSMRVRGAPAIAMVAILSLAVELKSLLESDHIMADGGVKHIKQRLAYLVASRPTAVNLADAARKMNSVIDKGLEANELKNETQPEARQVSLTNTYIAFAQHMLHEDVLTNKAIGRYGAEWILSQTCSSPVSVLTHCNTGSLATAGYGTALGVIRALNDMSSLKTAYCTETRPYNQGSRLTAFELVHDQIPACLITDSMASALFAVKGANENIVAVVVGADRVAANGDTANKIGTYNLAIAAKYHGVKFVVAAPRTSIDMSTSSGRDIAIEERPSEEMTIMRGPPVDSAGNVETPEISHTIRIAAQGINVWNPAFDVTPSHLIDAIVTEVGVVEKNSADQFDLSKVMGYMSNGV